MYGSSDIASAKSQSASSTIPGQIFGSSIETPLASSGVANKPRLLIIGLRRSGKSSILNVVFHKMPPNETIFLESTTVVSRYDILPFLDLQLWDFPGHVDVCDPSFDPVLLFQQCGAVMFVVDAQDDYLEALERLHSTIFKAFRINPDISFEIFVHKVDGLSDDHKIETKRDIYQRLYDDLGDVGVNAANLSFHLTSIYDHSVFEAFSKVIQKLIPQLATLENLLNMLCSVGIYNCSTNRWLKSGLNANDCFYYRIQELKRHFCLTWHLKYILRQIVHLLICNHMNYAAT
ncbi:GTP-binding protein gtr2, variant 2 [Batrachochytrium dendrobatidis]|nr:GTP-binding protein gtr2, variant 2 [Batrachochytrium dendrobatidis]